MITVNEKEHLEMVQNIEMIVRSDRVYETIYKEDSPEVVNWTAYFTERANISSIFFEIEKRIAVKNMALAEIVGTFWHHFSSLAPQVMSMAAAKVDSNLMRHYIVQIIYEELGTRNHRLIHPDLFLDAIESVGVTDKKRSDLISNHFNKLGFSYLNQIMSEAKSNSEILGILLGLEIDANENIQTILDSLAYDAKAEEVLISTPFFKIHRIAEDEHIRIDVANFLRFCQTEQEKEEFTDGFDKAVHFWNIYWKCMTQIFDEEMLHDQ